MWTIEDVDQAMTRALFDKEWYQALERLQREVSEADLGRARLSELRSGTDAFDRKVRDQLTGILERIHALSLPAVATGNSDVRGTVSIETSRDDFHDVYGALRSDGFIPVDRLHKGSLEIVRRVLGKVTLIHPVGPITRLELTCVGVTPRTGLTRRIQPTMADVRSLLLPGSLWPLYWIWRPVRLVGRALRGRTPQVAPFLSTPMGLIHDVLDSASPAAGETLVDVGCGDGRVLVEAVRHFGVRGIGIENDERLIQAARDRLAAENLEHRVSIFAGDFADADYSLADIVFLFLPVFIARPLVPWLLGRLRPGARVVAHEQSQPHWDVEPSSSRLIAGEHGVTVAYVWEA